MRFKCFVLAFACSFILNLSAEPLLAIILMVKDEEAAMQPTLQPFIDAGIDHYLILDTGSTDKTIHVTQELFKKHAISNGYIVEQPFVDFATSRNYALKCAEEKFPHAIFFLMIDAEWIIHNTQELIDFCNTNINDSCNLYGINMLMRKINSVHRMCVLVKASAKLRYKGATHEALVASFSRNVPHTVYFELPVTHYGDEKSKKRWERDRDILLQEYTKNPSDTRTLFYLGQTYACLKDYANSLKFYQIRADMPGTDEEDFISNYRLATLYDERKEWPTALYYYLKAYNMRPTRAEPLVWLAYHYLATKEYTLSYLFAKLAADIPYPKDDTLFIENEMYQYFRYDVLGHVAGYLNEFEIGEWAVRKALEAHPEKPHLHENLNLYLKIKESISHK